MIAIQKLKTYLESRFKGEMATDTPEGIQAVIEPNNAMSRRELRVLPVNPRLSELPKADPWAAFTPYELLMDVTIMLRLSGGNSGEWLTDQAAAHGVQMALALQHEVIVLKDVAQPLPALGLLPEYAGALAIVGDAELTGAARTLSVFDNGDAPGLEPNGNLFIYREVWTAQLVQTVHRQFINPLFTHGVFINDITGNEVIIDGDE